jgi:twinkle protein
MGLNLFVTTAERKEMRMKILETRGLDPVIAENYGVSVLQKDGIETVCFAYKRNGEVLNNKYRTFPEKKFWQDGGVKLVWNEDCLRDDTLSSQPVIITEGEFDALAAVQCGFPRTISVPDGAPAQQVGSRDSAKYDYLDELLPLLKGCNEIIIAADGDAVGANLLHDLSHRLGRARCKWIKYPKDCKDLNDALMKYGDKGVKKTIEKAEWVQVDGVYKMSDLPPPPESVAVSTGMGIDHRFKPRLGDFVIVTGIPSHGKSTFVNDLCCRLVDGQGWKTAFASFEQHPQLDHKRALMRWKTRKLPRARTQEESQDASKWIDDNFAFIVPSEDDDVTLDWFLDKASTAVVRFGCQIVVVDPWNEMDHIRPKDMSLTEYVGFAIKQFRKFARKHNILLIIVAHPSKLKPVEGKVPVPTLYDISDSAHWNNKADVGIIVHRNDITTTVRVEKVRYHDIIGKPGDIEMIYDFDTNRFEVSNIGKK